ncbi:MAG: CPBP family intramembrane metalloprotease [Clostridia bacterium]|nr:CPBP family intramembrane metalloprotease [Clostridia bacterium]
MILLDAPIRSPYQPPIDTGRLQRKAARKNIARLGFALLIYMLLTSVLQATITLLCNQFFPAFYNGPYFMLLLSGAGYLVGVPLFWGLVASMPKKAPKKQKLGFENGLAFLAVAYLFMMLGNYIANFLMALIQNLRGAEITNAVSAWITGMHPLILFAIVVVMGPIVEELIFRKWIIDRLLPYSEWLAVLTSALFFGLIHGNFYQFFYATFLGLLFSVVYTKTGKLRYTIAIHMLINFTGSIIAGFLQEATADLSGAASSFNLWHLVSAVYSMGMMALAVCGAIFLFRKVKDLRLSRHGEKDLPFRSQLSATWLNWGTILLCGYCFIMFIYSLFI